MPRKNRLIKERARRLASEMKRDDIKGAAKMRRIKHAFDGNVRDIARAYTEVAMAEVINILTRSKSEEKRLLAAGVILERGWGKPAQAIVGGGPDEPPVSHVHKIVEEIVYPEGRQPPASRQKKGK